MEVGVNGSIYLGTGNSVIFDEIEQIIELYCIIVEAIFEDLLIQS